MNPNPTNAPDETLSLRQQQIVLICILAVATLLRFYDLGTESLWNDELSSWDRSNARTIAEVIANMRGDVHPPGFQLLLYGVIRLFGDSEIALRMLSAIAGVAAVAALFALGKRLYGPRVGLAAAGLLAVQWEPIYYAQEARVFSLLLLVSILTSLVWIRLFLPGGSTVRRPGRSDLASYTLLAIIAAYLHYFGLVLVLLQLAGALLLALRPFRPRVAATVLAIAAALALAYLPWLPAMAAQFRGDGSAWISSPELARLLQKQFEFIFHGAPWLRLLLAGLLAVFLLDLALRATGRRALLAPGRSPASGLFLLIWAVLPIVAAYLWSVLIEPIWTPRNLIIVSPPVYLMLAVVLTGLPWRRIGTLLAAAAVLVSAQQTIFAGQYYGQVKKEQFREIAAYTCAQYRGDPIFVFTWRSNYFRYYLRDFCGPVDLYGRYGKAGDIGDFEAKLAETGADGFWYLAGHRTPAPAFLDQLKRQYRLVASKDFKGGAAQHYLLAPRDEP